MPLKKMTPFPFALVLLCLFLPFVSFSCDNLILETKTGFNLATGFQQGYEKVTPNPLIIVYIATALSAFIFSLFGLSRSFLAAVAGGAIAIISLVSFLLYIDSRMVRQYESLGLLFTYEYGLLIALAFLLTGTILSLICHFVCTDRANIPEQLQNVQYTSPIFPPASYDQSSALSESNLSGQPRIQAEQDTTKPLLVDITGQYAGRTIDLSIGGIQIGRDPRFLNIIYDRDHSTISRKHCTVEYDDNRDRFTIVDKSINGTYLYPDQRIKKSYGVEVESGTIFFLGDPGEHYEVRVV